ncbi:MAG: type IV pilus modification PilV family protein, partial [Planctomycetota bacterium]
MNGFHRQSGFSLTEVLMAIGVLSLGLIFIAGVFPAGIHFSTIANERTIGAIVADEAFAKIRLIAVNSNISTGDFNNFELTSFQQEVNDKLDPNDPNDDIDLNVFAYPSNFAPMRQFYWSALCRNAGNGYAQVT